MIIRYSHPKTTRLLHCSKVSYVEKDAQTDPMRKLSLCGTITDKILPEDSLLFSLLRRLPAKTVQWFEPLLEPDNPMHATQ
jgi:hypothetical protein